jgi:hypothetical protein
MYSAITEGLKAGDIVVTAGQIGYIRMQQLN